MTVALLIAGGFCALSSVALILAVCATSSRDTYCVRQYVWRLHACHGGHRLDPIFDTAADAGIWRRDNFGPDDPDSPNRVPLTLMAYTDGHMYPPTWQELADAQYEFVGGIGQL